MIDLFPTLPIPLAQPRAAEAFVLVGAARGQGGARSDERYPGFQNLFDEGVLRGEVLPGKRDDFQFTADGQCNFSDFIFVVHAIAYKCVGDEGNVYIAPFMVIPARVTAKQYSLLNGDIAPL